MSHASRLLSTIDQGDLRNARELLPLVYDELRSIAAAKLARESPGQTLQPTALVNEAFVRLVGSSDRERWQSLDHFRAAAAETMRRILVDRARRRRRPKHGGDRVRVEWIEPTTEDRDPLLELDAALQQLAEEDPVAARIVELRYFGGLGHEGVAELLGITVYAARARWTYARAWLRDVLQDP